MVRYEIATTRCRSAIDEAFEFVERKGVGHPDTLCDAIAETISASYSTYCLNLFGVVPHHWVDKCMLIGGESQLEFGNGRLIVPYRLIVAGKVTTSIGHHEIPVRHIAEEAASSVLAAKLTGFDPGNWLNLELAISSAIGAGRPVNWYRPDRVEDVSGGEVRSNDSVVCCGYAPMTPVERASVALEYYLNSDQYKQQNPDVGADIKVLATRIGSHVRFVICVPFIADHTPTRQYYDARLESLRVELVEIARAHCLNLSVEVEINTRDDQSTIYMTATGSAADTGDVGVVGRGNRANGTIAPGRPTGIEAPAGKNPSYHAGKIYSALAFDLASDINDLVGLPVDVYISTATGRPLDDPDSIAVKIYGDSDQADLELKDEVTALCESLLSEVDLYTGRFLSLSSPLW